MKTIFSILFFNISVISFAADFQIKGKIIDCSSKDDLYLINVGLLGTSIGSVTNESGEFILSGIKPGEYTLVASALGFEEQRVKIDLTTSETHEINLKLCEKAIDLDQIVVTGTRTERFLKDAPIQTQLISSKSIERMQLFNFRDLLEFELPGIEFNNNGGFANINMLGFSGKYVLFLIDGERMAGETFDNIDYNRIDLDNVSRIEIVKGANSSLYGSNAIGGVINIISKKPEEKIETAMNLRTGSNNEQVYRFSIGSELNFGYLSFTSSFKSVDPYLLKDTQALTQYYDDGKTVVLPIQESYIAGFKDYNLSPKFGINISENADIEIRGGLFFKERNPGGLTGTKIADDYYSYSAGIKGNYKFSKNRNISFSSIYDSYDKYKIYKLLNEKEKNYKNQHISLGLVYNYNWDQGHSLIAGSNYFSDNLLTYMFVSDGSNTQKTAFTYSAFLQQEYVLKTNIVFVGGLRYDFHSEFGSHLSPRISSMVKPFPLLTLRAGYAGGFRSPTLKELHTDWFHPDGGGFQILGNKDMKAEKSNNYNISAEVDVGRFVFTAMSQYSFIDNMVNTLWLNNDTVIYANIGKAKVLSSEIMITARLLNNVNFKGGYSFIHDNLGSNSVSRPHSVTGSIEQIINIYKHYNSILSLSGKYFSKVDIYGKGLLSDSSVEVENNEGEIYKVKYEAYSIFRLAFSQSLPRKFTINAGINNLLDYKAKFSGFYSSISPGRTYYVELKWRF